MQMLDAARLILTTTLSDREIGAAASLSKTTVGRYRRIAQTRGLTWAKISPLTPEAVHTLFRRPARGGKTKREPVWEVLHERMAHKGTTLQLLWEEYRREQPHGSLCYSHFAAKYRAYRDSLPSVMRQHHEPGERAFVDYSGLRPFYIDPSTRQKVHAELFVGVLGASSLFFATCTPSQKVPDFIAAHTAMLNYFGGVPRAIVPDNLKSAVVATGKAPKIQRTYADFARHYGTAILPTRPYRPRDKAAVEQAVKFAQQRIVARLHHQTFYSLDELNLAVAKLLVEANERPMVKDGLSRRARFEAIERAVLLPLPPTPYVYAEWVAIPRVPNDYHVAVDGHFYSVPHQLVGAKLDAKLTAEAVDLYTGRRHVAHHARSSRVGAHTTLPAHQTEAHRAQAGRTPEALTEWAKSVGPYTRKFVAQQLGRAQPFLGLPACDGLRALAHAHGHAPVERAAQAAFDLGTPTLNSVKRLLANAAAAPTTPPAPRNSNARRARAFVEDAVC